MIFKELKADISRAGVLPVRYCPFEPNSDFTVVYRGYELDVSRAPDRAGWLVSIREPPISPFFDAAKCILAIQIELLSKLRIELIACCGSEFL